MDALRVEKGDDGWHIIRETADGEFRSEAYAKKADAVDVAKAADDGRYEA